MENPYRGGDSQLFDLPLLRAWCREIGNGSWPEIGLVRQLDGGFGEIFGIRDLTAVPFGHWSSMVARAYGASEQKGPAIDIPSHPAWSTQFGYLKTWVNRGVEGIYGFAPSLPREREIRVIPRQDGLWTIREGHHRCLALWILRERQVWARVGEYVASS